VGARMCNTNNCPVGIATQKPELRAKMNINDGAEKLARFFDATNQLMQIMARACGHDQLAKLTLSDLTTWKKEMSDLSGVQFSGLSSFKK